MEQSESIKELAIALAKAQGEIAGAKKDATNPHFKSKYADLASCWDAVRKPLSSNGLSIVQLTDGEANTVIVITQLMHESGQWIRSQLKMVPTKSDPQGIGSCLTYARRYALSAMVGIAPEEDDGNAASAPNQQSKPAPVQAAGPTREQFPNELSKDDLKRQKNASMARIQALMDYSSITKDQAEIITRLTISTREGLDTLLSIEDELKSFNSRAASGELTSIEYEILQQNRSQAS